MTAATPLLANIDITELLLLLFVIFFIGLVLYLQRESRREGYPLEEDTTGRLEPIDGFTWWPKPKTFILPHNRGTVAKPDPKDRDTRTVAARRSAVWPGAPLVPTGDPMVDGVGAGAYAERAKVPDIDLHGNPRIAPLRTLAGFSLAKGEADPRGMTVLGADGRVAGTVRELWIDRMESLLRYIEVEVPLGDGGASRNVLVPFTMCTIDGEKRLVKNDSASAHQYKTAPALERNDQITRYEEERVIGFFGGGYLYANERRAEPLI
jgi:photosynthetic reaction center H subunit